MKNHENVTRVVCDDCQKVLDRAKGIKMAEKYKKLHSIKSSKIPKEEDHFPELFP